MRGTRPAVIAIIALLLAGCGVRLDSAPQSIPAGAIPSAAASATGAPSPSANPARAVRVWFAREDGLVPVLTDLRREPAVPPADIVAALAAGPSPEQAEDGLRTLVVDPLTDTPLASVAEEAPVTDAGSVVVTLSPDAGALPPGDQVLLLGQIVLSLTGAGYSSVTFVDGTGAPAAVPLPGGRLLDRPAVARDYAGLIIEL
ncbi:MAG: hypothetical protein ACO31X_01670 [Candidatus Nanopelagicales bacterium]